MFFELIICSEIHSDTAEPIALDLIDLQRSVQ